MAITEVTVVVGREVLDDGRIRLREEFQAWEGGTTNGFVKYRKHDFRIIEVGDDVSNEEPLVKDMVDGKIFTVARVTERDLVLNPPEV